MFKNHLKTTIRNIQRHKGYALINIAGLTIGMACCILIIIYILTELNYDRYHDNTNRIYRLGIDGNMGGNFIHLPVSNNPSAPILIQNYPEVLNAARIRPRSKISVKHIDKQFYEEGVFWADNSIFDVFTFPMVKGNPKSALVTAYSLVITEETAKKYFGDDEPLGKILRFSNQYDYTVTGVVKNVPRNSHFTFDMLCSLETSFVRNPQERDFWLNFNNFTYLLLPENYNYHELEKKFPALIERYMGQTLKALGGEATYFLQPLTKIHLHSHMEIEIQGNGNILYIYIFGAIALFILTIACINFMNLATARSATRAKEVSMRKVVGAHKNELIKQFFGETLVYSFISLLLALLIIRIGLPLFSSLSGVELQFNLLQMPWLIAGFLGIFLFVGIVAGTYPALFLSAFQPAKVLKGSIKAGPASSRFRSVLVVFQFVISIALIIGISIILSQIKYMKNRSLGFEKDNVLVVEIMDQRLRQSLDWVKTQAKSIPGVTRVSASSITPGQQPDLTAFLPEGFAEDQTQLMERINVDEDFIPTMGIEVVTGRNFSQNFGTDRSEAVIINETAAKKFGWDDPLGKTINVPANIQMEWEPRKVVGVVKDFHLTSLHRVIGPLLMTNNSEYLNTISIKLSGDNTARTMDMLKEKWKEIDPNRPLDYNFLDVFFDRQYRSEERLSEILASFTVFAIFIACLGLFGLASFMAEQRTKEIGIRKVLGASAPGVVVLLSKDFIKLVIIANIFAWPIAYFAMRSWLRNFAYRAGISVWIFLLTATLALAIALITVSYQSIRAALSNPVDAIKYE